MRLKNGPPCGPNAIVFSSCPVHGPQVGKTVSIVERSSIDPKSSVLVKVFRDVSVGQDVLDTLLVEEEVDSANVFKGLEVWQLSDVVFLDDAPSILGRVIAIDQQQVVVDVGFSQSQADMIPEGSSSKSTLKVFKLSELEPCMEGPDFQPKMKQDSGASTFLSSDAMSYQSVSHHIAGVVQHRPVCFVDPIPLKAHPTVTAPASNKLHGFKPLALQATDCGPNLLVQRVTDGKAFLVCSAHLNPAALSATSFIALGSRDAKVRHCTIREESVSAVEAGLAVNPALEDALDDWKRDISFLSMYSSFTSGSAGSLSPGQGEHTSTPPRAASSPRSSQSSPVRDRPMEGEGKEEEEEEPKRKPSSQEGALSHSQYQSGIHHHGDDALPSTSPLFFPTEFVSVSGSQPGLFFLRDVNGCIWPLLDGLSLKSCLEANYRGKRQGLPLHSYRCVTSRQYSTEKDGDVVVFVLGMLLVYMYMYSVHAHIYMYMYM